MTELVPRHRANPGDLVNEGEYILTATWRFDRPPTFAVVSVELACGPDGCLIPRSREVGEGDLPPYVVRGALGHGGDGCRFPFCDEVCQ